MPWFSIQSLSWSIKQNILDLIKYRSIYSDHTEQVQESLEKYLL